MSDFPLLDNLGQKQERRQPVYIEDEEDRGVLSDVALQLLGGGRDAVQQTLNTVGLGEDSGRKISMTLPEVDEPDTIAGSFARSGAQFFTGFIPAFRVLNAGKTAAKVAAFAKKTGISGRVASAIGLGVTAEVAAMAADQIVFDPRESRLSNLIQEVPELANPITEYLVSEPNDSEAEARFKLALEGAGLGLLVAPIVPVFRAMRNKRISSNLDDAFETAIKETDAEISKATDDIALGASTDDILRPTAQGERPFVNNKYLDTTDEIKNTLNATTRVFEKTIDKARRGKISTVQTQSLANQMGMTVEQLTKRRRGQAFNAEEALAARMILNKSADEVTQLAKLAVDPDANSDTLEFAFRRSLARHGAIQEQVMGMAAEAGRALRSFQIPAGAPDKAKAIKEILEQTNIGKHQDKLASMISRLDDPAALAGFIRAYHDPSFKDMGVEVWINWLLSGPTTQAVNVMSNSAVAMWTIPETAIAATLGIGRKGGDKVYMREVAARTHGLIQGAKDGVHLAAKTFMTEEPSDLLTKIEVNRYRAVPSVTFRKGQPKKMLGDMPIPFSGQIELGGKQIRIPGRLLQAGDEFFKSIGYRMEVNARAMRSGLDNGLKGERLSQHIKAVVDNPSDEIRIAATETARYQTFTNELGKVGKGIQNISKHHVFARFLMPFIRTPINIVKFAGARSPFGLAMDSVQQGLRAGGAIRDITRARIYMGSAVGAAVGKMAFDGLITGNGPKDPALRSTLYNSGWQPYSLKIGDKYYSYSRLEPLGMIFGVSADMAEIYEASTDIELSKLAAMVSYSISNNLTSKTYLRGLSEAILAMTDSERYGQRWWLRAAGTVVPTGVAQYARLQDPVLREANTITEQIRSRIPELSKDLYPRRNVWGEPIRLSGAAGPDIISPVYMSTINNDPVAQEMARLEIGVKKISRKIHGVILTDEQYDRYAMLSGRLAKRIVMSYVTSREWRNIPEYKKKEAIKSALSQSRKVVRDQIATEIAPQIAKQKLKERLQGIN